MHRSGSSTRTSEEFFMNASPSLNKGSPALRTGDMDQLPTYDPASDFAKKETARLKSAENSVHLIPLVLMICAIILWFFSHPDVAVMKQGDSVVARDQMVSSIVEDFNNLIGFTPTKGPDVLNRPEQSEDDEADRAMKEVKPK